MGTQNYQWNSSSPSVPHYKMQSFQSFSPYKQAIMPSGPKKRRASKRKKDQEATAQTNTSPGHATGGQEEAKSFTGSTSSEMNDSPVVEIVSPVNVAVPAAEKLSEGGKNVAQEDADQSVSSQNEEKASLSADDSIMNPPSEIQIPSVFKAIEEVTSEENVTSTDKLLVIDKEVAQEVLEFAPNEIEEKMLVTGTETSVNLPSLSGEEHDDPGNDASKDTLIFLDGKEIATANKVPHESSIVGLDVNQNVFPSSEKEDSTDSGSSKNEEGKLLTSAGGDCVIDYEAPYCPELSTTSKQINHACPVHCDSGCSFYSWVSSLFNEKNASDEQMERVKKMVERELKVADKLKMLLHKFLDELNAVQETHGP